jgi:hypothetical protein
MRSNNLVMLDIMTSASIPAALLHDLGFLTMFMRIMSHDGAAHAQLAGSSLRPLDVVSSHQMLMRLAGTKDVCGFAVDRIVACQQLGFGHPQWDSQHVLDEAHDERGPHDVPADDEERAVELHVDLLSVALDGAAGVGDAEGGAAFDGCEEADAHSADETGDAVGVEDAEGVVDLAEVGDFLAHDVHGSPLED